jgi:hypothetical protein
MKFDINNFSCSITAIKLVWLYQIPPKKTELKLKDVQFLKPSWTQNKINSIPNQKKVGKPYIFFSGGSYGI